MQGSTVEWISIGHGCLMKMDYRTMDGGCVSEAVSSTWEVVGAGGLIRGESHSR